LKSRNKKNINTDNNKAWEEVINDERIKKEDIIQNLNPFSKSKTPLNGTKITLQENYWQSQKFHKGSINQYPSNTGIEHAIIKSNWNSNLQSPNKSPIKEMTSAHDFLDANNKLKPISVKVEQ